MPALVKDLLLATLLVCLTMGFTGFLQASRNIPVDAEDICGNEPNENDCNGDAGNRRNNQENQAR